jgi:hypothetical protein
MRGIEAKLEIDAVKKLRSWACGTTNSALSFALSIRKRPLLVTSTGVHRPGEPCLSWRLRDTD